MLEVLFFGEDKIHRYSMTKRVVVLKANFKLWQHTAPKTILQPPYQNITLMINLIHNSEDEINFTALMLHLFDAVDFLDYTSCIQQ